MEECKIIITKEEVMPLLLMACPSFESYWLEYLNDSYGPGDEQLLYIDLGEFSQHLVRLYKQENTSEFAAVFEVVELLHIDGDDYVKEAATIGLLESIQNVSGNNQIDPEVFTQYFGTESLNWWRRLNDFWNGENRNG
jgi:hypothetical protein